MSDRLAAKDTLLRVRDSYACQGFPATTGARLVTVAPGRCVIETPFGGGVAQQHGFHGGAIGALADTAGAMRR